MCYRQIVIMPLYHLWSDRQFDALCWIDCNETVLIFKRVILYIYTQFTVSSNPQDLYHTNVCFNLSNIPKGKLFFSSRTPDIQLYYSVYSQQIQMYFIPTSQHSILINKLGKSGLFSLGNDLLCHMIQPFT